MLIQSAWKPLELIVNPAASATPSSMVPEIGQLCADVFTHRKFHRQVNTGVQQGACAGKEWARYT